tara:strand:- start:63 stop:626 length:564 start_codon:yes stop_codon:yes gene_type:complete
MSKFKHYNNGKHHYVTSFKKIELGDVEIELVKKCPCNDKEELRKIEGEFIRNNSCVNKVIAGRTKREYRQENAEKIKQQLKEIYEKNKEKYKENQNIYYELNKERILHGRRQYRSKNEELINNKQREYYEQNKERRRKDKREYYEKNKAKISETRSIKITCPLCGTLVSKRNIARHKKSSNCQNSKK